MSFVRGGIASHAVIGERDLERGVDRLRAGVREEHVIQPGGRDLHHGVGELERRRMSHLERRRVVHRLELVATASVISARPWPAFTHHRPGDAIQDLPPSGVQ